MSYPMGIICDVSSNFIHAARTHTHTHTRRTHTHAHAHTHTYKNTHGTRETELYSRTCRDSPFVRERRVLRSVRCVSRDLIESKQCPIFRVAYDRVCSTSVDDGTRRF